MREILFRGKRIDNGEWVEGYYAKAENYLDEREIHVIFPFDLTLFPHSEFSSYEEVLPESIGQFTSLCDKNGKKIFEGDIVQSIELELRGVIIFDEYCRFMIKDITTQDTYLTARNNEDIVVIGNIHDNPELLKGEAE